MALIAQPAVRHNQSKCHISSSPSCSLPTVPSVQPIFSPVPRVKDDAYSAEAE